MRVSIEPIAQSHDEPVVDNDIDIEKEVYAGFVSKRKELLDKAVIHDRGKLPPSGVVPEVEQDG
ncbi:MAG: hypothetical protein KDA71_18055 [Planctomycetales bacterium]|nr:hypothetical protein [Planctomycetales bacterium]